MKWIITLMLLPAMAFSQSPCPDDSIAMHIPKVMSMSSPPPPCYDPGCPIDSCHYSAIPDTGSFVVNFSNAGGVFNISVVTSCRWVLFDTCVDVNSGTPSFEIRQHFTGNEQLMVCGSGGELMMVFSKHVPEGNFPSFGIPILDLDTICGPLLPVTSARETVLHYMRMDTGEICDTPLSAGIYFEMDETFVPTGRKILVIESE